MDKPHALKILAAVHSIWPAQLMDKNILAWWVETLATIDYATALAVVKDIALTGRKFPPPASVVYREARLRMQAARTNASQQRTSAQQSDKAVRERVNAILKDMLAKIGTRHAA
jgi:methylthioribose-1-phosphate isomerase